MRVVSLGSIPGFTVYPYSWVSDYKRPKHKKPLAFRWWRPTICVFLTCRASHKNSRRQERNEFAQLLQKLSQDAQPLSKRQAVSWFSRLGRHSFRPKFLMPMHSIPIKRLVQRLDDLALKDALDSSSLRAVLVAAVYLASTLQRSVRSLRRDEEFEKAYESMLQNCAKACDRWLDLEKATTGRQLADLAWALAKLELLGIHTTSGRGIFLELRQRLAKAESVDFLASDLRKLAWALSVLSPDDVWLFGRLGDELAERQEELSSADVATIAFAYQRAGQNHSVLFHALAKRLPFCTLTAAGVAKLAAAFAGVGFHVQVSQGVFRELLSQATEKIDHFETQDLVNLLHATATITKTLEVEVQAFLEAASRRCEALCAASQGQRDPLLSKDLCSFAWSFAQLQCTKVLPTLARACLDHRNFHSFDPRFLSGQLCWAFGATRVDEPELFDAIAREVMRSPSAYQPRDVSVLAWSFARLGYHQPRLFDCLCGRAMGLLQKFNSQDMANMLWAFSHVGIIAPSLFTKATPLIRQNLPTYTLQELALVAWAFNSQLDQAQYVRKRMTSTSWQRLCLDSSMLGWWVAADLRRRMLRPSPARDVKAVLRQLRSLGVLDAETLSRARAELGRSSAKLAEGSPRPSQGAGEVRSCDREGDHARDQPCVVLDLLEEEVIYKPKGWEVEPTAGCAHKQLSDFVQQTVPKNPLNFDAANSYGFLHRLDVVTSGLVLRAKNYRAYHNLDFQLMEGSIDREYQVLCHGFWSRVACCLDLPVFALKGAVTRRSQVATPGARPARSDVKVLCHLSFGSTALSFAHISIQTGRRHQIRAQTAHVGHPVVSDSFYTTPSTFTDDQTIFADCFLHRYRLSFTDMSGVRREVFMPLPPHLSAALKSAEVKDPRSADLHLKPKSFAETKELRRRDRTGHPGISRRSQPRAEKRGNLWI
eukprot:s692_g23.t6